MFETIEYLKNYNYWHKNQVKTGYKRDIYLLKIKKYIGNKLIKVLVGQRRVGKSYILRQIIRELINNGVDPINTFYLNKEYFEFENIKTANDLNELFKQYLKKYKPKGIVYIFIDEVQEIEEWERFVNSMAQNTNSEYELFITGSNSHMLSGELATFLSGRYIAFEIMPFNYTEYCGFNNVEKNKGTFINYMRHGGLPELFNLPDEETKRHYVSSLKDTILLKDIVKRHRLKDVDLLETLFKYLIDNIGDMFSINNIVNYLNTNKRKTNNETLGNYLKYLKESFIIHEVERYNIKGKEKLTGNKKYYVNDLSWRNYLSSVFDEDIGKRLENLMYLHYRQNGYQIYVGEINKKEIDFVLEKEDKKQYVQVAYSIQNKEVQEREFGNFMLINDFYEKKVISLDEFSLGNKDGIEHYCAWEVL